MGFEEKHTINIIVVYSSRYEEMMTLEVKDIFGSERLPDIKSRFSKLLKKIL